MRLRKIVKGQRRTIITSIDILMSMVFPHASVTPFSPYQTYRRGDYVYMLNMNDGINVYKCTKPGRYKYDDMMEYWKIDGWEIESIASDRSIGSIREYTGIYELDKTGNTDIIAICNHLYSKVSQGHVVEIDGGSFLDTDVPPDPAPNMIQKIKQHDQQPNSHSNIVLDGGIIGQDQAIPALKELTAPDITPSELLEIHNYEPDAHADIVLDGGIVGQQPTPKISGGESTEDTLIRNHENEEHSHPNITVDGGVIH